MEGIGGVDRTVNLYRVRDARYLVMFSYQDKIEFNTLNYALSAACAAAAAASATNWARLTAC